MTTTTTASITQSTAFDDRTIYHDQLNKAVDPIIAEFDGIMYRYMAFNVFFICLCTIEVALLLTFFAFLAQSMILALCLAIVFFSFFAYFTLRIYFQTQKPEQLLMLKDRYVAMCKNLLHYQEGMIEHQASLANACCRLANRFHAREYDYYRPPSWIASTAPLMEKISCWWHWQDVHFIQEVLLQESVKEHINLVKLQPTSLHAHAALANAYVMLSGLYIDPKKIEGYDDDRWIPSEKYHEVFQKKFRTIAERAIEEFKILCEYAPDDPWVHSQLAYSYHDLQMPIEEIKEYEIIYSLTPDDQENLYKLGKLYFQQGMNAKGLRIYEELKKRHYTKVDSLLSYYGSHTT